VLADLTAPYNKPVCATGEAVFLHNIEMTGHEWGRSLPSTLVTMGTWWVHLRAQLHKTSSHIMEAIGANLQTCGERFFCLYAFLASLLSIAFLSYFFLTFSTSLLFLLVRVSLTCFTWLDTRSSEEMREELTRRPWVLRNVGIFALEVGKTARNFSSAFSPVLRRYTCIT